jgi:hypothetical protein
MIQVEIKGGRHERGEKMLRNALIAALACAASGAVCGATEQLYSPPMLPPILLDWPAPESVPPAFRNHCGFYQGHYYYCANHCGTGYQFYYCSPASFGCCHVGAGYCGGFSGALHCAPSIF